jgi:hypothetical protein
MTFTVSEPTNAASASEANPLTQNWEGPYGGIPPFDKVKVADFKPALEAAMAENLAEGREDRQRPGGSELSTTQSQRWRRPARRWTE